MRDLYECGRQAPGSLTLNTEILCAKAVTGNVCQGDSGSPLMCLKDNKYQLCGLVSGGSSSCGSESPAFFTRPSTLMSWIKDNTEIVGDLRADEE